MLAIMRVGASVVLMERFTVESIFNAIRTKGFPISRVTRLYLGLLSNPERKSTTPLAALLCDRGAPCRRIGSSPSKNASRNPLGGVRPDGGLSRLFRYPP
jgi:hypothetical protein